MSPSGSPLFDGKLALVTGASSGFGRSIALSLAAGGARVACVGRNPDGLNETLARIRAASGKKDDSAMFLCDVTEEAEVLALANSVKRSLGDVAILVNNAGAAESAPFAKTDRALWDRMIAVNLTGPYLVTHAFLPSMLEKKSGRVIVIASTAARVGYAYVSAYCAAKHGVLGLVRSLAREVAAKGVTVNAVCPSYADTPMTERTIANIVAKTGRSPAEARASIVANNPQGRLVTADDVASAVAWLASDGAAAVNGQAVNVCGGETFN